MPKCIFYILLILFTYFNVSAFYFFENRDDILGKSACPSPRLLWVKARSQVLLSRALRLEGTAMRGVKGGGRGKQSGVTRFL